MHYILAAILVVISCFSATAEEGGSRFAIGNDLYRGGQTVTIKDDGLDDVFLTAMRVSLRRAVTGSAHVVGRWVDVDADLGGSLYALAQRVSVDAPVLGDVSVVAQQVSVTAPVAGDLRSWGSETTVAAPVKGTVLISAELASINAPISGDVAILANEVDFGEDAQIEGLLTLYETRVGTLVVPAHVAPQERIQRLPRTDAPKAPDLFGEAAKRKAKQEARAAAERGDDGFQWPAFPTAFVQNWVILSLVLGLMAFVLPRFLRDLLDEARDTPGAVMLWGAIALSALLGAVILSALTLLGMVITPVILVVLVLAALGGYLMGAYLLGAVLLGFAGRRPDAPANRVLAALAGALAVLLLGVIPAAGWIVMILVTVLGLGALVLRLLEPALFSET
ncbi:MAG: hypothetical protein N4A61_09215 [Pelagimonas sp.]|jgi:hypothetical protein|nr:hypothetical protein [Pelagimonas sp.]